jgi:hypothetical protein
MTSALSWFLRILLSPAKALKRWLDQPNPVVALHRSLSGFASVFGRSTPMLLPVDLRNWLRGDGLAHFVLEAVEGMELGVATINQRGSGSEQYPPGMKMALLLYCNASGIFSSRRIEAASHWHVSVRYLAGNTHPDHDTIASFRRVNRELVRRSFVRVPGAGAGSGVAADGNDRD